MLVIHVLYYVVLLLLSLYTVALIVDLLVSLCKQALGKWIDKRMAISREAIWTKLQDGGWGLVRLEDVLKLQEQSLLRTNKGEIK